MEDNSQEVVNFPYVNFKLKGERYCISSKYVLQLIISSQYTKIPQTPEYVSGLLNTRGINFPIIDLRSLYSMDTVKKELNDLNIIKEKHLEWVLALEKSVLESTEFTLTRDPHKCSLGMWYDNYNNSSINHILMKIDVPHKELHKKAFSIDKCRIDKDFENEVKTLEAAKKLCYETIVPLLDELINEYMNLNKGMVILLSDGENNIGLQVDDIDNIDYFYNSRKEKPAIIDYGRAYIDDTIVSEDGKIYFELSVSGLFDLTNSVINNAKIS